MLSLLSFIEVWAAVDTQHECNLDDCFVATLRRTQGRSTVAGWSPVPIFMRLA